MNYNLKHYLITDPKYYTNDKTLFEDKLIKILENKKVDIACFRDKYSNNYRELAETFIKICKNFNIKEILLNTDYKLAYELNATGVHLNSTQFENIKEAKKLKLNTIISCHSLEDIKKARDLNCDTVTFSPIFHTPNKGEPKGVSELKKAINLYKDINIIALGGIINEEQVKQVEETKAYAFASIRYFI
ncbi:thiamine phosphate synthase [Arcobacter sp. s6]|uniref:thiamine phosphate synthase n=1 Tax=Arcobacter sp. s6 TaxID=3230363 RepID=UPI0034A03679